MNGALTIWGQLKLLLEGLYGPSWAGAKLALIVGGDMGTPNAVWDPTLEATFTGYSRLPVTWGSVGWSSTGQVVRVVGTSVGQWSGPPDLSGQTVTGVALVQANESGSGSGSPGDPVLLGGFNFVGPTGLQVPLDLLAVTFEVDLTGSTVGQVA